MLWAVSFWLEKSHHEDKTVHMHELSPLCHSPFLRWEPRQALAAVTVVYFDPKTLTSSTRSSRLCNLIWDPTPSMNLSLNFSFFCLSHFFCFMFSFQSLNLCQQITFCTRKGSSGVDGGWEMVELLLRARSGTLPTGLQKSLGAAQDARASDSVNYGEINWRKSLSGLKGYVIQLLTHRFLAVLA